MICFKDRAFCSSDCTIKECYRHFGKEEREAARDWWGDTEGDPPISFMDFSEDCPDYTPPSKEKVL